MQLVHRYRGIAAGIWYCDSLTPPCTPRSDKSPHGDLERISAICDANAVLHANIRRKGVTKIMRSSAIQPPTGSHGSEHSFLERRSV